MRLVTSTWFECKVLYYKTDENGKECKVKETYVAEEGGFGNAEARIWEEVAPFAGEGMVITDIHIAIYSDVLFKDEIPAEKWFKVKVVLSFMDEVTAKERKSVKYFLVNANDITDAKTTVQEAVKEFDYSIVKIEEAPIENVFES